MRIIFLLFPFLLAACSTFDDADPDPDNFNSGERFSCNAIGLQLKPLAVRCADSGLLSIEGVSLLSPAREIEQPPAGASFLVLQFHRAWRSNQASITFPSHEVTCIKSGDPGIASTCFVEPMSGLALGYVDIRCDLLKVGIVEINERAALTPRDCF